jgi:large subunit ribosomal protein L18
MITPKYVLEDRRKQRVRKSIRKKISGTKEKPRMIVFRSNKYLYVQVYDDINRKVLVSASTLEKEIKEQLKSTKNKDAAKLVGKLISDRLKKKKINSVVFDRNVYAYAGRVKIIADSARENGINF